MQILMELDRTELYLTSPIAPEFDLNREVISFVVTDDREID